jgi:hypothetical protein
MIDELLDLPIPHKMNQAMINYLGTKKWSFVGDLDKKYQPSFYDMVSNPLIKDSGQAIISYRKYDDCENDITLNFFGDLVFFLIQEKSKLKIKNVSRFYWNLYTPQSVCHEHTDDHNIGKSVSAVYSFHTNDGGTQVENEFASSKEGQAVVFKSEKKHKGITTKTSNFRLNLNIVMELE